MDKLRMESPDMVAQNIDRIAALFPNCITEMPDEERSTSEKKVYKRAVNFELLKQMLSPDVVDGDEAYEFTWVGKKAATTALQRAYRASLPMRSQDVPWLLPPIFSMARSLWMQEATNRLWTVIRRRQFISI